MVADTWVRVVYVTQICWEKKRQSWSQGMGYCCDNPVHASFLEACGGLWTKKMFDASRREQWTILVGTRKIVVLRARWTMGTKLNRFPKGIILATGLETLLVIFWQGMWLLFALVFGNVCRCPQGQKRTLYHLESELLAFQKHPS